VRGVLKRRDHHGDRLDQVAHRPERVAVLHRRDRSHQQLLPLPRAVRSLARDRLVASAWMGHGDRGIEGVVAKRRDQGDQISADISELDAQSRP
jgi:hypothetical protein